MAKKKSFKKACQDFEKQLDEISGFIDAMKANKITKKQLSLIHELAIIRVYSSFETLILELMVASINRDAKSTIGRVTGINFPKHLNDEVCRYLIVGNGYFNFKDRSGLIKLLKQFLPEEHFLVDEIKKPENKDLIERLIALRNFSAHHTSPRAKRKALDILGQRRLASAGSWLKSRDRFRELIRGLKRLSKNIQERAEQS